MELPEEEEVGEDSGIALLIHNVQSNAIVPRSLSVSFFSSDQLIICKLLFYLIRFIFFFRVKTDIPVPLMGMEEDVM